jgi:putative DNA primase/helicase
LTINLGTMEEYEPRREDYITKEMGCPWAPKGTSCPLFLSFLYKIMGGDKELVGYLQRVCGYCLTGSIKEHAMFFLYGAGSNGKSVFVGVLRGVFGDYHKTAPIEAFTASSTIQHCTDMAGLMGARLVTAVETEEGRVWAEAKIKAITGGDEISARFMRVDFFEFTPQFKLMIAGNHKPSLRTVDVAIRRRLQLIPFNVTIPKAEQDLDLPEKLRAEYSAIARWMIDGCEIWMKEGLNPPQAVIDATNLYFEAEDSIGTWIAERCECKATYQDTHAKLFASWKSWADLAGEEAGSTKAFGQKMEKRAEFTRIKNVGPTKAKGYSGIRVRETEAEANRGYRDD